MSPEPREVAQRVPGTHLDRRLRLTGELFPDPGCRDLALIQRVRDALTQLSDRDAAQVGENTATNPTQE